MQVPTFTYSGVVITEDLERLGNIKYHPALQARLGLAFAYHPTPKAWLKHALRSGLKGRQMINGHHQDDSQPSINFGARESSVRIARPNSHARTWTGIRPQPKNNQMGKQDAFPSGGAEPLELLPRVLEVLFSNLRFKHFFDNRQEVGQGAHGGQRRSVGGPDHAAYRGEHEGVLDLFCRYAALIELEGQQSVWPAWFAAGSWRVAINFENLPHVVFAVG
jgi:hypothetical protein